MYLSDSINHSIYQKVNLENIINFYKTQKSDKKFHKGLSIETPIHVMLIRNMCFIITVFLH